MARTTAAETGERPAFIEGALHGCLEDLLVFDTLQAAMDQARSENARDHRPPRIDDRLVNKTERLGQLKRELVRVFRIADLSAAHWADLEEFVQRGCDTTARRRGMIEAMTQHCVDALDQAGVTIVDFLREDWQVSEEDRTTARIACTIVQFYRNCGDAEKKKMAGRVGLLGYAEAGVALYVDEHGRRHAESYDGPPTRAA